MRSITTIMLLLLLMGCASTELVSSTESTVVVKAELKKPDQAQAIADTECGRNGKTAKLNQFVPANVLWANYFFDCE